MRKDPTLVAIGKRVRELREAKGFAQEAFANEVGLDRSYYGGIERGERNFAALNIVKVAKALNAEVGELFPKLKELR
jgi:transcriptional regulator with XRE-family HTH domain